MSGRTLRPAAHQAIALGIVTEERARDIDALFDSLLARLDAGELTWKQLVERAIAEGAALADEKRRAAAAFEVKPKGGKP